MKLTAIKSILKEGKVNASLHTIALIYQAFNPNSELARIYKARELIGISDNYNRAIKLARKLNDGGEITVCGEECETILNSGVIRLSVTKKEIRSFKRIGDARTLLTGNFRKPKIKRRRKS